MQEWHLENKRYEVLEKSNGDCVVKDKESNRYYFQTGYFISQKYEFHDKTQIFWNWKDNLLVFGIALSLISMTAVFFNYGSIYSGNTHFTSVEYCKTFVFVLSNILIHEMAHYYVMRFYGRRAGKIKLKLYLKIFPCIVTNTSDSYMLPEYRRCFVYYAGIMLNWIICGIVLAFFPRYEYLLRCIVWMAIYNMIPFGGIKTDGYHIIVNTLLGIKDLKEKKNLISELAKYAFFVFAIIMFYQSFSIMFGY